MTKIIALVAVGIFAVTSAFVGDNGHCTKKVGNAEKVACLDYATLNLTSDQKSKIEAWQADCVKAGCTKESRHTFLKQAKGVLSPEQFVKLKEQCKGNGKNKGKTQA